MAAGSPIIAQRQAATFQHLWQRMAPHVSTDRALPFRFESLLRNNRGFGSRDRRLYRELFYTGLRYYPWINNRESPIGDLELKLLIWLCTSTAATQPLKAAFVDEWPQLPQTLAEKSAIAQARGVSQAARSLLPGWFETECPAAFAPPNYDILAIRAPLWIRLQTEDVQAVAREFSSRGWTWTPSRLQTDAWRLETEADVESTPSFQEGRFEVQDIGSQWVLAQGRPQPGERWLDACAGAGGKTLQLARLVGSTGQVDAYDVRATALTELRHRVDRARLRTVRVVTKLSGTYDGVLVDAPCSGSGTWRRAPHLKWSTSQSTLVGMSRLQLEILARASQQVRTGGRLVYATCSLARSENEQVIERFIEQHSNFSRWQESDAESVGNETWGHTLLPSTFDSDGFYVAVLRHNPG